MFRVLWRFPLYGSGGTTAAQEDTGESWAWPLTAYDVRVPDLTTGNPVDWVEMGHKLRSR